MKFDRVWAAAAIALAGLGAAIAVTAVSSADGAPRGRVLDAPASVAAPGSAGAALGGCRVAPGGGASALRLGGPCPGLLTADFACVNEGELEALSVGAPSSGGRRLYVTVLLFDFAGPGEYFDDEVTVQVIGGDGAPRWSSRGTRLDIVLTPAGTYEIGGGVLLPEPGTPAAGVITLEGRIACR